jgi:hypothetical protein
VTEVSSSPQQQIFEAFAAAAPTNWRTGRITYRMAGRTSEFSVSATDEDGTVSSPGVAGFELGDAVEELRERMAQPGKGAWLSATIELEASGRISIDVDYDGEPAWDAPVVDETYVEEQELHPRDDEFQPPWYRDKLRTVASS